MSLALPTGPREVSFYNLAHGLVFDKIIGYLGDRAICNLRGVNRSCENYITHQLMHNPNALDRVLRLYPRSGQFPLDELVNRVRSQLFKEQLTNTEEVVKNNIAEIIGDEIEAGQIPAQVFLDLLNDIKEGNIWGKYEFCSSIINELIKLNSVSKIDPSIYPTIIRALLELGNIIPTNRITEVKSLRYSLFDAFDNLVTDAFDQEDEQDHEITEAAQVIIEEMETILKMIESFASCTDEDNLTKRTRIKSLELLINLIEAGRKTGFESISEDIHAQLTKILPLIYHIFTHINDQNMESMNLVIEFLYRLDEADHIEETYFNDICNLLKFLPQGKLGARATLIQVVCNIYDNSVNNYGTAVTLSLNNVNDLLNFFKQSKNEERSRFTSLDVLTDIYINKQEARTSIEAEFDFFLASFNSLDKDSVEDKAERGVFIELFNKMAEYSTELKQKLLGKY